MATWYVYNIPTNETVNLRAAANSSGTILVRVGYGKAVEASASSASGWHNASYGGYNGYIMSQYLTLTNPSGGSTVPSNAQYNTIANVGQWVEVKNNDVNVRKTVPSGEILYRVSAPTQSEVFDKDYAVQDGINYTWYKIKPGTTSGWIRGDFLKSCATPGNPGGTGTGTYKTGNLGRITAVGTNIRTATSTTSGISLGEFPVGCQFVIGDTVTGNTVNGSNVWVKIYWGQTTGISTTKYIHSSCFVDTGVGIGQTAKSKFITIAKSLTGVTGAMIECNGKWCQNWMSWLAAATAMNYTLPIESMCPDGLNYFGTRYSVPQVGDWVYYVYTSNPGNADHVGLVTNVNTTAMTFDSVEGNLKSDGSASGSGTATIVKSVTGVSYSTGLGTNAPGRRVLCFVRPSY